MFGLSSVSYVETWQCIISEPPKPHIAISTIHVCPHCWSKYPRFEHCHFGHMVPAHTPASPVAVGFSCHFTLYPIFRKNGLYHSSHPGVIQDALASIFNLITFMSSLYRQSMVQTHNTCSERQSHSNQIYLWCSNECFWLLLPNEKYGQNLPFCS